MDGRVLQMSGVKKKPVILHTYIVLLSNSKKVEVEAESYHDVGTEDGEIILYRWERDKATVLQMDAADVKTIVSKSVEGWEAILDAVQMPVKAKRGVKK